MTERDSGSDFYRKEAAEYLGRKPSLTDRVMDWIRKHKRETSWTVIGATIMTPIVANATESGYVESGEIQNGLDDMGIVLSAKNETENPTPAPGPEPGLPTPSTEKIDLATGEYYKPLSEEEKVFWLSVINNPDSTETLPLELIQRVEIEYKNKLYGKYYQELIDKGYTDENTLEDRGVWLYAFDNFVCSYNDGTEYRLSDFGINREDVLNGKNLNVYECENGRKIWLPNFNKKMTQSFVKMIDWFKSNGEENIEEFLIGNGLGAVLPVVYDSTDGDGVALLFSDSRLVNLNLDENVLESKKDVFMTNNLISLLPHETLGIFYLDFMSFVNGTEFTGYEKEAAKALVVGYNFLYLYEKTGNMIYKVFGDNIVGLAIGKTYDGNGNVVDVTHELLLWHQIDLLTKKAIPLGTNNWDFLAKWRKEKLGY
jgi:hypothetical protein